jgi:hypothetical protein
VLRRHSSNLVVPAVALALAVASSLFWLSRPAGATTAASTGVVPIASAGVPGVNAVQAGAVGAATAGSTAVTCVVCLLPW